MINEIIKKNKKWRQETEINDEKERKQVRKVKKGVSDTLTRKFEFASHNRLEMATTILTQEYLDSPRHQQ
jgi:hypothetical protein